MFETAELGRKVAKRDFKRLAAPLREELLQLQERLRRGKEFQVILLFSGVDGAGKGETVGLLNEWMDPRWLMTRAYDEPRDAERERPEFWRYWRDLPPAGRIGMFLSAWYHATLLDRVYRDIDEAAFVRRLDRIIAFERALAQDRRPDPEVLDASQRERPGGPAQEPGARSPDKGPRHAARLGELAQLSEVHCRRRSADLPGPTGAWRPGPSSRGPIPTIGA